MRKNFSTKVFNNYGSVLVYQQPIGLYQSTFSDQCLGKLLRSCTWNPFAESDFWHSTNLTMQKSSRTVSVTLELLKLPLISWDVSVLKTLCSAATTDVFSNSWWWYLTRFIRWWYLTRFPMSLLTINSWRSSIDSGWEISDSGNYLLAKHLHLLPDAFSSRCSCKSCENRRCGCKRFNALCLMQCLVCVHILWCQIINNGLKRTETMKGIANDGQFYFDCTSFLICSASLLCASCYVFLLW